jgi:hypothetical protein
MVLRWIAAGMGEAAKQFRRVNGYLHLSTLRVALDETTLLSHRARRMPPDHLGPPPKFHAMRDILKFYGTRDMLPEHPASALGYRHG